jgi:uncharacterized surface protein with fasciclin (FAS1) repeats
MKRFPKHRMAYSNAINVLTIKAASLLCVLLLLSIPTSCSTSDHTPHEGTSSAQTHGPGQEAVKDDESMPNIVKIATGSADHTTLVTALKAANLVTSMANAGPFTVFAPTNAAFDKLPQGTLENLLKPENKDKLTDILYHHVLTSALESDSFTDGQTLTMFDGKPATVSRKDGTLYIEGAKVVGSIRASNGIVHVVDAVILAK